MILLLETIPPRFEPQSPGKFWMTGLLIVPNSDVLVLGCPVFGSPLNLEFINSFSGSFVTKLII